MLFPALQFFPLAPKSDLVRTWHLTAFEVFLTGGRQEQGPLWAVAWEELCSSTLLGAREGCTEVSQAGGDSHAEENRPGGAL